MSLVEQTLYEHPVDEKLLHIFNSKKPWVAPELMLISLPSISNNAGGSGDSDASLAHLS